MLKTGIYVDAANINQNGGWGMRYDVLKRVATRGEAYLVRANAYVVRDREREKNNQEWKEKIERYFEKLRSFGFKLIEKNVVVYRDEDGNINRKANADMELAVDALVQSRSLDRILLLSGDGDFTRLVTALQNMGCRVEVLAFSNYNYRLKNEADFFINGYLIPDLIPFGDKNEWGKEGNQVRGVITNWISRQKYGFVRFLEDIKMDITNMENWNTAILHENSILNEYHFDKNLIGKIVQFKLVQRKEDRRWAAVDAIILEV